MHQLLPSVHGALLRFLRNQFKITTPFSSISPFHSSDETVVSDSKLDFIFKDVEEVQSLKPITETKGDKVEDEQSPSQRESYELIPIEAKVQISHPWPEWVGLMERLLKTGYFRGYENPLGSDEMGIKNSNEIRTACLNFARDRLDLIRYFSRKDIQVVVGSGCPSMDRKVVNSGKRLRSHVGVDEGNVCSTCSLRGSCERAFVKARQTECGRTVDVMRILITYGLDPITNSVENKSCLNKSIKESVRRLLTEMVEFSIKLDSDPVKGTISSIPECSEQQKDQINVTMKQGDWVCPKCNFRNFAKNIKCLRCDWLFQEKLMKLREDQDHLPMKKGDWLCDKCNFLNFAKNTRCLQCQEKPTNRQLNPGEWECESCNYVNFKKNMACLRCNWKRPKALKYQDLSAQHHHEDGSIPKAHHRKFVRDDDEAYDQPSTVYKIQHQKNGANFWRGVEDDLHQVDGSNNFEFQDFPIVGGKSPLSQNPQERQRWKEEMSTRSLNFSRQREYDDVLSSASFKRRLGFVESTDDEDIDGWFGQEERKKQISINVNLRHVDDD